jgi:type I site-specific restriction-modification system R (restriction) subunit
MCRCSRRPIALFINGWSTVFRSRGDFVRLIDFGDLPRTSSWRSTSSPSRGRTVHAGPDIILFINGLPLVLMELKNPADEDADIWKAYDQIQTYKEQIPDVFQHNDAPCVHTLYVDKPMKGHNLMQAIGRVNRVFRDKQGGLVVDYIGIANDLKQALKEHSQ